MKLLHVSLLLVGTGAGLFGLHTKGTSASLLDCPSGACSVEVECIDPDTCLVTCYDTNGAVLCQEVLPCEGPCPASACSTSCGSGSSGAPAPVPAQVSAQALDDC
jgi:hypothetical protein